MFFGAKPGCNYEARYTVLIGLDIPRDYYYTRNNVFFYNILF